MRQPEPAAGRNLQSIFDRIRPAVESIARDGTSGDDSAALVDAAVKANIRAATEQLRTGSEILERLVAAGALRVVGAEYSLESGVVDFFDGVS